MGEWQPIETAPKDDIAVDLWMADQDGRQWRVTDARFVRNYQDYLYDYAADGSYTKVHCKRDGWFAPNHSYDGGDGWADSPRRFNNHPRQKREIWVLPTHWMPLPPPPKPATR